MSKAVANVPGLVQIADDMMHLHEDSGFPERDRAVAPCPSQASIQCSRGLRKASARVVILLGPKLHLGNVNDHTCLAW